MKKITCKELDDPNGPPSTCTYVFKVNSFDDLVKQGEEHVRNTPQHAQDMKEMESATEQEKEQWMNTAKKIYDSKPEEQN